MSAVIRNKIHPDALAIWTDALPTHGYRILQKGRIAKRKLDANVTHGMGLSLGSWPGGVYRIQPAALFFFGPATRLLAEHVPSWDPKGPLIAPGFYGIGHTPPKVDPFVSGDRENDVKVISKLVDHYSEAIEPWFWSLSDPEVLIKEAGKGQPLDRTAFFAATAAVVYSKWDVVNELLSVSPDILKESERVIQDAGLRNWIAYLVKSRSRLR